MWAGQPMYWNRAFHENQWWLYSQRLAAAGQALLKAAQQGDAATVRVLLATGLDPNTPRQPCTGWSALHLAAAGGHVSAIIILLAFGAVVDDSTAPEAVTPLRLALHGKHLQAVQVLLGAGSTTVSEGLQAKAEMGSLVTTLAGGGFEVSQTALGHAIKAGDFQTLKLLLQFGVLPGDVCGEALVAAAGKGHVAEVEALLGAGVPAYEPVWDGDDGEEHEDEPRTALMAAAVGGHTDVMRCLLAAGADVEACWWTYLEELDESVHVTALEVCGTAEAARLLLEAGALLQDPARGYFPLITRIWLENEDMVPVLLEAGADPNLAGSAGKTALHHAVDLDLAEAVESLLAAGADVNMESELGSALHMARSSGVALMLLRAGADIEAARGSDGRTPLLSAAWSGRGEVVKVLLEAGALVHATDNSGGTALHYAGAMGGYSAEQVVELLCAAGADVNATNTGGKTPLGLAVEYGSKEAVVALIAAGAVTTMDLLSSALRCWPSWMTGSWMTVLLPSHSISMAQLRKWANAAFHNDQQAKQAMVWGMCALRRRLPTELVHFIAALRCMLK